MIVLYFSLSNKEEILAVPIDATILDAFRNLDSKNEPAHNVEFKCDYKRGKKQIYIRYFDLVSLVYHLTFETQCCFARLTVHFAEVEP